jgi:hypothetical protein
MDPTEYVSPTPSPEDGNGSSYRNIALFNVENTGWWTKSKNPVIPTVKLLSHVENCMGSEQSVRNSIRQNPSLMNLWGNDFPYTKLRFPLSGGCA